MRSRGWLFVLALGGAGCQWVFGIDPDELRDAPDAAADAGADVGGPDVRVAEGGDVPECGELEANARELWVDVASTRPENGTAPCPFRTITAALARANASSATNKIVYVAAGIYAAETFPLVVRGLELRGAGASKTIVRGTGAHDQTPFGGDYAEALEVTFLVGHATEPTIVADLSVQPPPAVSAPLDPYVGVLCDRGNSPLVPTSPAVSGNTFLRGVAVGPNYETGIMVTNSRVPEDSSCNVVVTSSTITGNAFGSWVHGCGRRLFAGGPYVSAQFGDGTLAGANRFVQQRRDFLPGDPNGGRGILAWDCTHTLRILGNRFEGNDRGVQIEQSSTGNTFINGNVFRDQRYVGLYLVKWPDVRELLDNTFEGTVREGANAPAKITSVTDLGIALWIRLDSNEAHTPGASIKRARGNRFSGNEVGILIDTGFASKIAASDFGRTSDPGNNEIACNSSQHPSYPHGGDFLMAAAVPADGGVHLFQGNKWDHAPPTLMAEGGAVADGIDIYRPSVVPVASDEASASTMACDAGFVRGP
jgi:hypothetical protein